LFVDDVSPAPDCGHLVVHIVVQTGHSVADAIDALRRDQSRLCIQGRDCSERRSRSCAFSSLVVQTPASFIRTILDLRPS
jgi:hypothetical protein